MYCRQDRDLQHPDIAAAERTGYPDRYHSKHSVVCSDCGFTAPEDGDDSFYRWEGDVICGECLEAKIDDMSLVEKAALLGADRIA